MRDACEVAQHHAETVVQGHGDAQPVLLREAHGFTDEKTVIEDIVVRQGGTFRRARGAGRELNVDGVIKLQGSADFFQVRQVGVGDALHQGIEVMHARCGGRAQADDVAQLGQARRLQGARARTGDLRHYVLHDGQVIAGLEAGRQDQRAALHLVEHVFEFRTPVGGVDVDHDQAGFRRGELGQHPFGAILRPDADPVARLQAQLQQAGGQTVHALLEFQIRPAHVLVRHDQGIVLAIAGGDGVQVSAYRFADQRCLVGAMYITHCLHAVSRVMARRALVIVFDAENYSPNHPRPAPACCNVQAGATLSGHDTDTKAWTAQYSLPHRALS